MRVLITGGAGFIGSHTADALLAAGYAVRILDILDPQIHGPSGNFPAYLDPRIECLRGDVRDLETVNRALDGIDAVYHFAAGTGVGQSMYDISGYVSTNGVGTATVLEAIVKRGPPFPRLILSSSRAVYGEGSYRCAEHGVVFPGVRPRHQLADADFVPRCPHCAAPVESIATSEDRPLQPVSVYGLTKKHQEDLCAQIAETHGIPLVILRYFNVYGSRQSLNNPYTGVVTVFYNRIRAEKTCALYERGLPVRDFVHVLDVARANLLALTAQSAVGQVINIGSGEFLTIGALAEGLAAAMGRRATLQATDQYRVGDIYACVAELTRAREALGYEARVTLASGMREFVAWADGQETRDRYDVTVEELSRHGLFGHGHER